MAPGAAADGKTLWGPLWGLPRVGLPGVLSAGGSPLYVV